MTVQSTQKVASIHDRTIQLRKETTNHRQANPVSLKAPGSNGHVDPVPVKTVTLVVQRKPLSEGPMPRWVKWFLQWVYFRYGFAASNDGQNPQDDYYSIEYKGVFTDPAEARYYASGDGASLTVLPLNGELPDETCQFEIHDFPLSDASSRYRNRKLAYVAVPLNEFNAIGRRIDQLANP